MREMMAADLGPTWEERIAAKRAKFPIICMTREAFEDLGEYSCTYPTGVFPGRRWRRHDGAMSPVKRERAIAAWFVLEYVEVDEKNCRIAWYRPVLSRDMVAGDIGLEP